MRRKTQNRTKLSLKHGAHVQTTRAERAAIATGVLIPCHTCHVGYFRPTTVHDMRIRYRDEPQIPIKEDVQFPVCDHCGEMRLSPTDVEVLEALLAHRR
jgi:hypothetical protein